MVGLCVGSVTGLQVEYFLNCMFMYVTLFVFRPGLSRQQYTSIEKKRISVSSILFGYCILFIISYNKKKKEVFI
jgi:hypothetical protein